MREGKPNPAASALAPAGGGGFWGWLARAQQLRRRIPMPIKRMVFRFLPREKIEEQWWAADDPYANAEEVSMYPAKVDVRLGILKEFTHAHKHYIGACRDMGVPYRLIDLAAPDWVSRVRQSGCDAFLVHPSAHMTVWKRMFDERLKVLVDDLGKMIYPSYEELWLYESKRRMHYWLQAHSVPHPQTWVFYSRRQALEFCRTAPLPIVFKSDLGAGASGVRIFRRRGALERFVNFCFTKGVVRRNGDPRDRQWGSVILQEYLADAAEWRVIRIGRSYFAHQKLKKGEFHSGSGSVGWYRPSQGLLDIVRQVTDLGGFTSMDCDIFQTAEGRYVFNELQCMFGFERPYQMLIDQRPGRFLHSQETGWQFQEGVFCQNGGSNLRVEVLIEKLGRNSPGWPTNTSQTAIFS